MWGAVIVSPGWRMGRGDTGPLGGGWAPTMNTQAQMYGCGSSARVSQVSSSR
jgi:hypothetical protein